MELKITVINNISPMLQQLKKELDNIPKEAHKEFVKVTPIKTGNAKRKTRLDNDTIVADYGYAEVLDKGRHMTPRGLRGSEQAPKGMTEPTVDFIKKRLSQIVRGK